MPKGRGYGKKRGKKKFSMRAGMRAGKSKRRFSRVNYMAGTVI